jgi:glycogen phosphorylase
MSTETVPEAPAATHIQLPPRLGMDAESIRHDFTEKLFYALMKFPTVATRNDHYLALAMVIRDRMLERWVRSASKFLDGEHRTVIYLSAEYLLGPQLGNALLALGIEPAVRTALAGMGISLDALIEHEEEPGLGNGGLGRLAACFMDSLATLELPAIGHGIRYEFGIFDQQIRDGWQVEKTDRWLRPGFPWEVRRHDIEHAVGLGGRTENYVDDQGRFRVRWLPERVIKGMPSDIPVLGAGTANTNFLRLWSAFADDEFDLDAFQVGEYWRAVDAKVKSENITKVLYPADTRPAGKQLRLEQEHFFVSCALQDCLRLLVARGDVHRFAELFAIQLNDTHPSLAVPELMRLLMDVHGLEWAEAWSITTKAISYTNHTLMPEALETWPLPLFARLLPRHMEIIYEINKRFLDEVRARFPGDEAMVQRMSIIDEHGDRSVRMAYLATVASHAVNGVAALHSQLLRDTVLRDFATVWPERFTNVTNGVTPRRFVALANPKLAGLIDEVVGPGWMRDLDQLAGLERVADDAGFRERWRAIKLANKDALASWLLRHGGAVIDPAAMLDAQCKRMHEYKRQHLNLLHVAWLYDKIRRGDVAGVAPRTVLMAGKAAPAYTMAKLFIRLCNAMGDTIERDPATRGLLRVVFVPDFNVKNAQHIYPAADLSEQISTAGTEASGTGNMKFALNGALTIGTLDGANVEIREAVGADEFFLFGMTTAEVTARRAAGYSPGAVVDADPELAMLLDSIAHGRYAPDQPALFAPFVQDLIQRDPFMVLADFRAYVECQARVARAWHDVDWWTRASIRNVARCGRFSSDRSIKEYAERIWNVSPVPVTL